MSTLIRPALARPRTALLAVLALIATMIGGLFAATPALAHDELVATTPSAGETVTAAPSSIGLEFSQEMLPEGTFAEVRGEDGADYADGTPTVEGTIVTIPLKTGLPNGVYTVNWQITSSDGHPTQGNWTFTLAAEQTPATQQAPATDPTPDPNEATPVTASTEPTTAPTTPTETSGSASADATAADSGSPVLGIMIGLIVIAAVVAALAVMLLRRRATRG
ncbi:copper resistance protein CopC [Microbacterium sp. ZW T5_56]|uniref:copper resistance CopC family protein n=1 Tax=Microbacterium sp. ZW T5_56 TaxID=3378081 RepID=UPI0038518F14